MDNSKWGKVAVLCGGVSREREISLRSGEAVCHGLRQAGIDAFMLDMIGPLDDLSQYSGQFDTAFNVVHGGYGENGELSNYLAQMGKRFTGCDGISSALTFDKEACKSHLRDHGSLVLPSINEETLTAVTRPLCVKPNMDGSSFGVERVETLQALKAAMAQRVQLGEMIIEPWIDGPEYTVGIVGEQILPVVCITVPEGFYDYEAKYVSNNTCYDCPAGLSQEEELHVRQLAWDAFVQCGCSGWGRVDFVKDVDGQFYIMEINSTPGMTKRSLVPMAAQNIGWSFSELTTQILETCSTDTVSSTHPIGAQA